MTELLENDQQTQKQETNTEESNQQQLIDSALKSDAFRKKFDEETEKKAMEKADRLILEKEIKNYDDDYLKNNLKSYIELTPSEDYDALRKRRDDVVQNSKKYSLEQLQEAKREFEIAYKTEEKLKAQRTRLDEKRSEHSIPTIEESGSTSNIKHRTDFSEHQIKRLRDIHYEAGIEPTLAWTKEFNDIRASKPGIEDRIRSKII